MDVGRGKFCASSRFQGGVRFRPGGEVVPRILVGSMLRQLCSEQFVHIRDTEASRANVEVPGRQSGYDQSDQNTTDKKAVIRFCRWRSNSVPALGYT